MKNNKLTKAIITTIVIFGLSIPLALAIKNIKKPNNIEAETKIEYTVDYADGNNILKSAKVEKDGYSPVENPTKEGYTFLGWSLSPAGEIVDISEIPITSDTTFYANFRINQYPIFLKNEEGKQLGVIELDYGTQFLETITRVLPDPPTDYEFIGFFDKDGNQITADLILKSELVLTAKYKKVVFTYNFYNGNELILTKKVRINETLSEADHPADLTDSITFIKFAGWFSENGEKSTAPATKDNDFYGRFAIKYSGKYSLKNYSIEIDNLIDLNNYQELIIGNTDKSPNKRFFILAGIKSDEFKNNAVPRSSNYTNSELGITYYFQIILNQSVGIIRVNILKVNEDNSFTNLGYLDFEFSEYTEFYK